MAGNWMDDRERDGRGFSDQGDDGRAPRYGEDRSWDRDEQPGRFAARRSGPGRDRVFGEGESGAGYNGPQGAPYRSGSAAGGWQEPARGPQGTSARFETNDYTAGGRFYGDDQREPIYREEYGQGGAERGNVPLGYDAQRSMSGERYRDQGHGRLGFGAYPGEHGGRAQRPLSGGTGGYDYAERGYGDAGRREGRGDRLEDASRNAGEFLHRAGEKVASWFNSAGEGRTPDRDYLEPNANGKRGLGPQGYKRSDERISEDAHERLTDDAFLDASNIAIAVSGGEVTLSGTVDSRDAKHRAERLVDRISGVTHVQNNLRLMNGRLPTPDDAVANGMGGSGGGPSTAGPKT